jgi:8-oxo-dGTP pyrophosphatase MutT (NUDIX family)
MAQMYKVFISDRPLILKARHDSAVELRDGHLHFHAASADELTRIVNLLRGDNDIRAVYVYNADPNVLFRALKLLTTEVVAAGGFVRNASGEALFIHRRGHWDLPKGKIDAGETPEVAAVREVEEECGISRLTITSPLPNTYHIYPEKDQLILKTTHWFAMVSDDQSKLVPQAEEGIDDAQWVARKHWRELVRTSYPNITELVEHIVANNL